MLRLTHEDDETVHTQAPLGFRLGGTGGALAGFVDAGRQEGVINDGCVVYNPLHEHRHQNQGDRRRLRISRPACFQSREKLRLSHGVIDDATFESLLEDE
jgi:hypothetical protein